MALVEQMPSPARLAIHWFRRDLRILDNSALHAAAAASEAVLPVVRACVRWGSEGVLLSGARR